MNAKAFHNVCRLVAEYCPSPYARAYANAGRRLYQKDEIRAQALYILSNMGTWRGELAKACRVTLKSFGRGA